MKKSLLFAAAALSFTAVNAAETVELKVYKDWAKGSFVKSLPDGVWEIPGPRDVCSAKNIKIDPAKKYTLSFDVRKTPDTQKVFLYVGYWPLNEDMVRINARNARCEKNTATTLTADAKAGSKSIRITQPKRWPKNVKTWCVSFVDQKACPGMDMEVVRCLSSGEQAADGSMEIKLREALLKDFKAGTAVHFHSEGPGMYAVCNEKDPKTEWESVSVTITGQQTAAGIPPRDKWWIGAKYAKIRFLLVSRDRKAKVQLRNIKLTVE